MDLPSGVGLTHDKCLESVFEIADLWTESLEMSDYLDFLQRLYNTITRMVEVTDGERMWEDLYDIEAMVEEDSDDDSDDEDDEDDIELTADELRLLNTFVEEKAEYDKKKSKKSRKKKKKKKKKMKKKMKKKQINKQINKSSIGDRLYSRASSRSSRATSSRIPSNEKCLGLLQLLFEEGLITTEERDSLKGKLFKGVINVYMRAQLHSLTQRVERESPNDIVFEPHEVLIIRSLLHLKESDVESQALLYHHYTNTHFFDMGEGDNDDPATFMDAQTLGESGILRTTKPPTTDKNQLYRSEVYRRPPSASPKSTASSNSTQPLSGSPFFSNSLSLSKRPRSMSIAATKRRLGIHEIVRMHDSIHRAVTAVPRQQRRHTAGPTCSRVQDENRGRDSRTAPVMGGRSRHTTMGIRLASDEDHRLEEIYASSPPPSSVTRPLSTTMKALAPSLGYGETYLRVLRSPTSHGTPPVRGASAPKVNTKLGPDALQRQRRRLESRNSLGGTGVLSGKINPETQKNCRKGESTLLRTTGISSKVGRRSTGSLPTASKTTSSSISDHKRREQPVQGKVLSFEAGGMEKRPAQHLSRSTHVLSRTNASSPSKGKEKMDNNNNKKKKEDEGGELNYEATLGLWDKRISLDDIPGHVRSIMMSRKEKEDGQGSKAIASLSAWSSSSESTRNSSRSLTAKHNKPRNVASPSTAPSNHSFSSSSSSSSSSSLRTSSSNQRSRDKRKGSRSKRSMLTLDVPFPQLIEGDETVVTHREMIPDTEEAGGSGREAEYDETVCVSPVTTKQTVPGGGSGHIVLDEFGSNTNSEDSRGRISTSPSSPSVLTRRASSKVFGGRPHTVSSNTARSPSRATLLPSRIGSRKASVLITNALPLHSPNEKRGTSISSKSSTTLLENDKKKKSKKKKKAASSIDLLDLASDTAIIHSNPIIVRHTTSVSPSTTTKSTRPATTMHSIPSKVTATATSKPAKEPKGGKPKRRLSVETTDQSESKEGGGRGAPEELQQEGTRPQSPIEQVWASMNRQEKEENPQVDEKMAKKYRLLETLREDLTARWTQKYYNRFGFFPTSKTRRNVSLLKPFISTHNAATSEIMEDLSSQVLPLIQTIMSMEGYRTFTSASIREFLEAHGLWALFPQSVTHRPTNRSVSFL